MLLFVVIYTFVTRKEINYKFPKFYRLFNRFILDRIINKAENNLSGHIICFSGFQGSGKTYNSISYILRHMHAYKCVYSNIKLTNIDYVYFEDVTFLLDNNVTNALIFIDEIQYILENKLKDTELYYFLCTLRKRGNLIVCTSQIFERVDLKIREQIDTLVQCKCYWGLLNIMRTYNNIILTANNKFSRFYNMGGVISYDVQSNYIRSCYNTYDLPVKSKS